MGILYLSVELFFDLVACILGGILICHAGDIIQSCIGELSLYVSVWYLCGRISVG